MAKPILGVVAGLAVWLALASVAGLILRAAWPEYAHVATAMTFNLSMKIARLAIGAIATVAAGVVARAVARYHLTFLLSLVPLSYFGGRIVRCPGISASELVSKARAACSS